MIRLFHRIVLVCACLSLFGCESVYRVFYYTSPTGVWGDPGIPLPELNAIIEETIEPFGFRRDTKLFAESDFVYFKIKEICLAEKLESLDGSTATLCIALDTTDPQICVTDFSNIMEATDFMKALRDAISRRLEEEGVNAKIKISHFGL